MQFELILSFSDNQDQSPIKKHEFISKAYINCYCQIPKEKSKNKIFILFTSIEFQGLKLYFKFLTETFNLYSSGFICFEMEINHNILQHVLP